MCLWLLAMRPRRAVLLQPLVTVLAMMVAGKRRGVAALVAVSAPSALAVRTAAVAQLQLAGFARGGRLNLYVEPGAR